MGKIELIGETGVGVFWYKTKVGCEAEEVRRQGAGILGG